jgi:hypothetical protein
MAESMHDIYQRFCADERFATLGAALGRGVVDDALVYEITVSELDSTAAIRAAVEDFAADSALEVADSGRGSLVLRHPTPNS